MRNIYIFILFMAYSFHVNSQKIISEHHFKKDTLYRIAYNGQQIVKNSNEIRALLNCYPNETIDENLYDFLIQKPPFNNLLFNYCSPIDHCNPIVEKPSFYCAGGRERDTSTTQYYREPIQNPYFQKPENKEEWLTYKKSQTEKLRLLRKEWHKEFPLKNDMFFASIEENLSNASCVQILSLSGRDSNRLSKNILYFENLVELYLLDHELEELPDYLFELKHLRILHLGGNHIKVISEGISKLENLEELYLDDNPIEHLPSSLFDLKRMIVLSLAYSKIKIIPKELSSFIYLKELNLNGVLIESIPEESIQLSYLQGIVVSELAPIIYDPKYNNLIKHFILITAK